MIAGDVNVIFKAAMLVLGKSPDYAFQLRSRRAGWSSLTGHSAGLDLWVVWNTQSTVFH